MVLFCDLTVFLLLTCSFSMQKSVSTLLFLNNRLKFGGEMLVKRSQTSILIFRFTRIVAVDMWLVQTSGTSIKGGEREKKEIHHVATAQPQDAVNSSIQSGDPISTHHLRRVRGIFMWDFFCLLLFLVTLKKGSGEITVCRYLFVGVKKTMDCAVAEVSTGLLRAQSSQREMRKPLLLHVASSRTWTRSRLPATPIRHEWDSGVEKGYHVEPASQAEQRQEAQPLRGCWKGEDCPLWRCQGWRWTAVEVPWPQQ